LENDFLGLFFVGNGKKQAGFAFPTTPDSIFFLSAEKGGGFWSNSKLIYYEGYVYI